MDDFLEHRLGYFLPMTVTLVALCAAFAGIAYAIDHDHPFSESGAAAAGMLIGLAVWIGLIACFIGSGAGYAIRRRRQARRHAAHVEAVRRRSTRR